MAKQIKQIQQMLIKLYRIAVFNSEDTIAKLNRFFIIAFLLYSMQVNAQERIIYTGQAKSIDQNTKPEAQLKSATADKAAGLPFYDDFSDQNSIHPNPDRWLNDNVFINNTLAINPPSIGVASFDGLDGNGNYYDSIKNNNNADTLTSVPITLNINDKKVILSFFYQPKGISEGPDIGDSLYVDFYDKKNLKWQTIWQAGFKPSDTTVTELYLKDNTKKLWKPDTLPFQEFKPVMLPITQNEFLLDSFQFRFRNKVSYSGLNSKPEREFNVDFWHIDYVFLDKDRNISDSLVYNDFAMTKPVGSLLNEFSSIPYWHLNTANTSIFKDNIFVFVRNLYNAQRTIQGFEFEAFEKISQRMSESVGDQYQGGALALNGNEEKGKTLPIQNYVKKIFNPALINDSADFDVTISFSLESDKNIQNNKVIIPQKFFNYYAFDDGTAEAGYGLDGAGTTSASCAMKYFTYKIDTLRAFQMYFNEGYERANQKSFIMMIWENDNGKPGELIAQQAGARPQFKEGFNQFVNYELDNPIVLEDTFFIGWKQITDKFLNVGMDLNTNSKGKLFYQLDNSDEWIPSNIEGTLMLRPVFGQKLPASVQEISQHLDVLIYPNPASDQVNINWQNRLNGVTVKYMLFDAIGNLIYNSTGGQNIYQLSTNNLAKGLYLLKITDNHQINITKKIIVK